MARDQMIFPESVTLDGLLTTTGNTYSDIGSSSPVEMLKAALREIANDLQTRIQRDPTPVEMMQAILDIGVDAPMPQTPNPSTTTKTLWEHLDEDDSV
jgi:hypothetical protein